MLEKTHFITQISEGQPISIKTPKGDVSDTCEANIGYLKGEQRQIKAIVCEGITDDEVWSVFNVLNKDGIAIDYIAVKGAVSNDQEKRLCEKYFAPGKNNLTLKGPIVIGDNGLKIFLDTKETPNKTTQLLKADAVLLDSTVTKEVVMWNEDNQLISHGGLIQNMLLDMSECDVHKDLLEQVTPSDVVAMLIDDQCSFEMFDAMIIKYRQLEPIMQKLADALKQSDNEEFFVKSVTPIEPFKRLGVVNVGAIFTMSDTQTITVLFNNPDTTPNKILPSDIITSWKWILNKRDVTAVLQPRAVDAKKYPMIAKRMFQLLAKNHARFKRAQATKNKDEALLNELINQLEAKQLEDQMLDQKYDDILKEMDEISLNNQKRSDAIAINKDDSTQEQGNEETATTSLSLNVGDFVSAKFAKLNKNNTIEEYQTEVAEGRYIELECIIQKVVNLSADEYETFTHSLLSDNENIQGLGGLYSNDNDKDNHAINLVVAVVAPGKETIIVDPQGYNYARYVGIDAVKIEASEGFEYTFINETGEAQEKEVTVPKVDGGEFGDFNLPNEKPELRAAVKEAMKDLVGKSFPCPALNTDVYIRNSGVKKILSTSADPRKLQALAALKDLLQNAVQIESLNTYAKEEEQNIVAYHILKSPLQIDEELVNVRFVIREDDKGHYHYDHSINNEVVQNAKSPLLDGLFTAVLPKSGVSQEYLAKLIRNADCKLDPIIKSSPGEVNSMLDSAISSEEVLNIFIDDDQPKEIQQGSQFSENQQFLNKLIAGDVDLGADETGQRLEQIGENLDPEDESLFEQAANIYAEFALKNATSLNG